MLLVKNGTITIHLKLDTWKEPGQKKHIKDPAKHDFKRYSTDVSSWEQPALMPELKCKAGHSTFRETRKVCEQNRHKLFSQWTSIDLPSKGLLFINTITKNKIVCGWYHGP